MARQRKPPKNTYRVQVDAQIPPMRFRDALRASGIDLKSNPETLEWYAVEIEKNGAKESQS